MVLATNSNPLQWIQIDRLKVWMGRAGDPDCRNSIQGARRKIKVAMRPEILVNTGESTRRNYFPDNYVLAPFNSLIRPKMFPVIFDQFFFGIGLKSLSHKG